MKTSRLNTGILLLALIGSAPLHAQRWTGEKSNAWYEKHPWLVGANYAPASAINQLEMWQKDTFDLSGIDKELRWAEDIGMNTLRVFLHDALWKQDAKGYRGRIGQFLNVAAKHKIKPMFVLFDSVWDPNPKLGPQRMPKPGVHNSGWVQGPGAAVLQNPASHKDLEAYVKGVIGAFGQDDRVLAWDLWNEPENLNRNSYGKQEPANKAELVNALLAKSFEWARTARSRQPLTSGVWQGDWSSPAKLSATEKIQLAQSDVISFHNYGPADEFEKRITWLRRYRRPILCTEYMARGNKSTFESTLPVAKRLKVAAYNWGLVAGKTQTNLPWDSWQKPYVDREPEIWFHEVFYPDGKPYKQSEVDLIRKLTGRGKVR